MAKSGRESALREMRAIIGPDASERHMIHSLHLARDNLESALNIYFDTPKGDFVKPVPVARRPVTPRQNVASRPEHSITVRPQHLSLPTGVAAGCTGPDKCEPTGVVVAVTNVEAPQPIRAPPATSEPKVHDLTGFLPTFSGSELVMPTPITWTGISGQPALEGNTGPKDALVNLSPAGDAPTVSRPNLPVLAATTWTGGPREPAIETEATAEDGGSCTEDCSKVSSILDNRVINDANFLSKDITSYSPTPSSSTGHLASNPSRNDFQSRGSNEPLRAVTPFPTQSSRKGIPNLTKSILRIDLESTHSANVDLYGKATVSGEWMLLGESEVAGCSTCKGSKVQIGDPIFFAFPKADKPKAYDSRRLWNRGKAPAEIVRFSCPGHGEIGRLPKDWASCLIPLVHANKVKLEGRCRDAPAVLEIMSSIYMNVRVYMNRNLFTKYESLWRNPLSASEATTNLPLPSLLTFLGHKSVTKAEFTPEDLLRRKRSLNFGKQNNQEPDLLREEKRRKLAEGASEAGSAEEELSDEELNELVGTSDNAGIEEMEPSNALLCSLWPYQKQALHWMTNRESGTATEAANALHPCWEAYSLADKSVPRFYLNVFTGEATLEFPSAMQTAKGGILADAMGLGKTVMTISLIITNPGKGGFSDVKRSAPSEALPTSLNPSKAILSRATIQKGGGTLIVCPMSLLAQWKSEFETHVTPGHITVHTYYGGDRNRDLKDLVNYDIVLTTYSTLQSEYSKLAHESPIQSVHWFRIVLDEAHAIKNSRSSCAQAIFSLTADRSWCLTGTPIQNKLEDVFSLLHFLHVEPWANWAWWNKLIQKPFAEGDERALPLLQYVLKPLMLRRTKDTKDKEGRAILKLPPVDMDFVYCDLSDAERDFYEAIHKKSKIKFDRFVEQGKVLHNYASILEMLLRMRQCCDHPFLVLSRSDNEEFSDLDKLAKRFLNGDTEVEQDLAARPTKAYVEEVVAELRSGDNTECPICLEAMEDSVLTPCAHRMCRECLFASWRSSGGGKCPLCRAPVSKQDLITAPSSSRFHIDVEKNWTESAKITKFMEHLEQAQLSGSKSVIFSQWTAFLDLLEIALKRKKLRFVRLDGSLSQQQRQRVVEEFSTNPDTTLMLLSLKAGGVGLNLTAASNAFLLDPWWNPAVEEQAIMRIHRIGQTKPVVVKRFVVRGTVEEKMLQVQARKQRMITGALTDQHDVKYARIEELKMLFR